MLAREQNKGGRIRNKGVIFSVLGYKIGIWTIKQKGTNIAPETDEGYPYKTTKRHNSKTTAAYWKKRH